MNTTEEAARRLITPHLWDGEEILWCDLPQAKGGVALASARRSFYMTLGGLSSIAIIYLVIESNVTENSGERLGLLITGAVLTGVALVVGTLSAWVRGALAARSMAYAVTNRRVLIVRGNDVEWVGGRGLDDVAIRGNDVVLMPRRSELEELWNPQRPVPDQGLGRELVERANDARRELTLAAVRDPQHVLALVQTLQHPTAS